MDIYTKDNKANKNQGDDDDGSQYQITHHVPGCATFLPAHLLVRANS